LCLTLNVAKSCCLKIGSTYDKPSLGLVTSAGHLIKWVNQVRYLGVILLSSRSFTCSLDASKKSFNRAANCVIGRLGGPTARNNAVLVELIKTKCIPILMYGTEASSLRKAQISSLDFSVVRFGMKILHSVNRQSVIQSLSDLGLSLPGECIVRRIAKFKHKFESSQNVMCQTVLLL